MTSHTWASLTTLLLLSASIVLLSANALAQPSAAKHAQGLHQSGVQALHAKEFDSASTSFEQAYRTHPRALYLHEAAKSNQRGKDQGWALLLAQCAQIEKASPLTPEVATRNNALIAELVKKTSFKHHPNPLSSYCSTLDKDPRMGRHPEQADAGQPKGVKKARTKDVIERGDGCMGLKCSSDSELKKGFGRIVSTGQIDTPIKKNTTAKQAMAKIKSLKFKGTCNKGVIRRVVRLRFNAFKYCYEKELQKDPKLQGDVTISWDIFYKGKASKVKTLADGVGNPKVSACMVRTIKRSRFPSHEKTCSVEQTFSFTSVPIKLRSPRRL